MKILNFYDDCRDTCIHFERYANCSLACYPMNKAPIHPKSLRRMLNVKLIAETGSDTLREAKEKQKAILNEFWR